MRCCRVEVKFEIFSDQKRKKEACLFRRKSSKSNSVYFLQWLRCPSNQVHYKTTSLQYTNTILLANDHRAHRSIGRGYFSLTRNLVQVQIHSCVKTQLEKLCHSCGFTQLERKLVYSTQYTSWFRQKKITISSLLKKLPKSHIVTERSSKKGVSHIAQN